VNARDDLIRAACYAACDLGDSLTADERRTDPAYRAACERVIFVHRTWPLIEYARAIEAAAWAVAEQELYDWYVSIGYGDDEQEAARGA
jgi:hypothetical protein